MTADFCIIFIPVCDTIANALFLNLFHLDLNIKKYYALLAISFYDHKRGLCSL